MTYFFVFLLSCTFNNDTSHWFLYVASVKTVLSLPPFLIVFTKYPTKFEFKIQKSQDKKTKRHCQENISPFWLRENCMQKNEKKSSNQSCDVMPTNDVVLHKLQKLLFTIIRRSNSSENFRKFLEKRPWWSTLLVKLL